MPPTFDLFFFAFVFSWELFWLWKGIRDARADDLRYQILRDIVVKNCNDLDALKKEVRDILAEISDRLEIAIERDEHPERTDTLRAVGSSK